MKTTERAPSQGPTHFVVRYVGHRPGQHRPTNRLFLSRGTAESWINSIGGLGCDASEYYVDYATWQEREEAMFQQGVYQAPPWAQEPFWEARSHEHFAHISLLNPVLMAYTQTPGHGQADRQTQIKPAKYLAQNFPTLTPRQLTFYAEWFAKGDRPDAMSHAVLGFANTPDEIVDVYDKGPHSCMRSKKAVAPYGAGDLAVAYLTDPDRPESVMARALCWPEQKVYGRVYPTVEYYENQQHDQQLFGSKDVAKAYNDSLADRLRKLGWTSILENESGFDGARMLKMPVESNSSQQVYRFPYLDNGVKFSSQDDTYWVLGADEDIKAGDYGGTVYIQGNRTVDYDVDYSEDHDHDEDDYYEYSCDHCGHESNDSNDYHPVFARWTHIRGSSDSYAYCENCRDNRTFYCDATEEYYRNDTTDYVWIEDCNQTWVLGYAEVNAFVCDGSGEWASNDEKILLGNGERVCTAWFDDYGFICTYDCSRHATDDMSKQWPGFPASYDDDDSVTLEDRITHMSSDVLECLVELVTIMTTNMVSQPELEAAA